MEETVLPPEQAASLVDTIRKYYDEKENLVKTEKWFQGSLNRGEEYEYDETGRLNHRMYKNPEGKTIGEEFFRYRGNVKEIYRENPSSNPNAQSIGEEHFDRLGRKVTKLEDNFNKRTDYVYEGDSTEPIRIVVTTEHGTRVWEEGKG